MKQPSSSQASAITQRKEYTKPLVQKINLVTEKEVFGGGSCAVSPSTEAMGGCGIESNCA